MYSRSTFYPCFSEHRAGTGSINNSANCAAAFATSKATRKSFIRHAAAGRMQITPEIVRALYGRSRCHTKCESCGADEPLDDQFDRCGRCQETPYCSRECQRKHWSVHKQFCSEQPADIKFSNRFMRRMDRFAHVYGPMISRACTMQFAMHGLRDDKISPKTHVMFVYVSDLPVAAKKPRLRIDKMNPVPMEDLPERRRRQIEEGMSFHKTFAIAYFLVYKVPEESSFFMHPVISSDQDNLVDSMLQSFGTLSSTQRQTISVITVSWIKSINDMAMGQRPDLFAAMEK